MSDLFKTVKTALWVTLFLLLADIVVGWREEIIWTRWLRSTITYFVFALILSFVSAYYNKYVSKKYNWADHPRQQLIIGSIGSVVVLIVVYAFARMLLFTVYYGLSFEEFIENERLSYYSVFAGIAVIISLFFHAFYFYKALQENRVKEQKIIAGTASAKFDALKNQLDPHFLFNSLNVLTSLIEENPHQAQKFTTSLSKVYRYVLEQKNKDLVSVDEELQFASTYVRLLKMRFEDSIVFDIPETSQNPEGKIVPLSLQLLLENAVKHNIVTTSKPLHIKVYEDNGSLVVQNNLQQKQTVKKGTGVGLFNIQQRYDILTERRVDIQKSDTDFSVRLPVLSKQISVMETQEEYIEDKRYEKAKEKVEKIKGFYGNLTAYCLVIPFLAYLNYRTTSFVWVIFPALGWGFGLLMHGLEAFGYNPFLGKRWEEKKMREFMEDER